MSFSDQWCSPPEIADALESFCNGPVDVDPCSNAQSVIKARIAYTTGGLLLPWRHPRRTKTVVYENYPYSQGLAWARKAIAEMACGNVHELIRLTMFQSSTQWWADMCMLPRRNPRILGLKRLAFIDPRPGRPRQGCRFEPALTYFGPRIRAFERAFAHLTNWSTWGR